MFIFFNNYLRKELKNGRHMWYCLSFRWAHYKAFYKIKSKIISKTMNVKIYRIFCLPINLMGASITCNSACV
ncbi:hypothetical protein PUN28_005628 [Cardiocondyla obscurior]|uniref:Uncharacterized protein n=1 Tax=Cardiocondyla obscurior TaxID=286306 RepID=A0AAW2GGY7_9HYME